MSKNWFALYTKPRHEFKAEEDCLAAGIEFYLPKLTTLKQWSDRKKRITEPLLRGYIFVYVTERERLDILLSKNIVSTVSFSGVPAIIPQFQIENLKNLLKDNPSLKIENKLIKGTEVVITDGPFKEVVGVVFQDANNQDHLAVSIELLNRTVVVSLPSNSVTKKK